jgi:hypothetical protein
VFIHFLVLPGQILNQGQAMLKTTLRNPFAIRRVTLYLFRHRRSERHDGIFLENIRKR